MNNKFKRGDKVKILESAHLRTAGRVATVLGQSGGTVSLRIEPHIISKVYGIPLDRVDEADCRWLVEIRDLEFATRSDKQLQFNFMYE